MKQSFLKILCLIIMLSFITIGNLPLTAKAYNSTSTQSDIGLCSTNYEWRYKLINGKMYKRKYNSSTNKWIGKWIPA